jgi:hypothetical protein
MIYYPTRQTLRNWKTGKTPVADYDELILERERKAKRLEKGDARLE